MQSYLLLSLLAQEGDLIQDVVELIVLNILELRVAKLQRIVASLKEYQICNCLNLLYNEYGIDITLRLFKIAVNDELLTKLRSRCYNSLLHTLIYRKSSDFNNIAVFRIILLAADDLESLIMAKDDCGNTFYHWLVYRKEQEAYEKVIVDIGGIYLLNTLKNSHNDDGFTPEEYKYGHFFIRM